MTRRGFEAKVAIEVLKERQGLIELPICTSSLRPPYSSGNVAAAVI
jgi:hypothetical protein